MVVSASLKINFNRVQEQFDELVLSRQVPGMSVAVLRDALPELQRVAADELASEFNTDPSILAQRVGIVPPVRDTRRTAEGAIFLKSQFIPLRRFPTKQLTRGVGVYTHGRGSGRVIPGAFGPNIRRLGRGVFTRKSRRRLPIRREPGINLREERAAQSAMNRAREQGRAIVQRWLVIHAERLIESSTRGVTLYGPEFIQSRDDGPAFGERVTSL